MNPFDYVRSINKGQHIQESVIKEDYSMFLVSLAFSMYADTILHANEVNCLPDLTEQMHYDYLRHSIRPRSRWKPWPKKSKVTGDNLKLIIEVYKYSYPKAIKALEILTDEQIRWIQEQQEEGG